jgi:cobalt/nickel transport system permease protein
VTGFLERTIRDLSESVEHIFYAEDVAASRGFLQDLDARTKVAGLLALIAAASMSAKLQVIAAILMIALLLAFVSRMPIRMMATKVWPAALIFSGLIAAPAMFLTPGAELWMAPLLGWSVTRQGVTTASLLILRVETAATLSFLLALSTPWTRILKALRVFRVPAVVVVILEMTSRYILLLLESSRDMFESRKSRTVGPLAARERRHLAVTSAGVLLSKTVQLSGEVYLAMLSRGFHGEIYVLGEHRMRIRDWTVLGMFLAIAACALWIGR